MIRVGEGEQITSAKTAVKSSVKTLAVLLELPRQNLQMTPAQAAAEIGHSMRAVDTSTRKKGPLGGDAMKMNSAPGAGRRVDAPLELRRNGPFVAQGRLNEELDTCGLECIKGRSGFLEE